MKRLHYLFAFVSLGLIALGQSTSGAMRESPGRALRRAVGEIEISGEDEANKLERYLALLSRHADDFDPSYDQDIELNARRQALFLAQGGDGNPKAFVPFAEVEKWQPTNETQTAIWNLIERTAQTYAALHTGGWMEVSKPRLPPGLASALRHETAFCQITNTFMSFDEKVYNDVSRNIQNSCFRDGENSLALRMRYLRMALGMSPLWHERIDDQVKDLKVTLDASGEVASYSFTRAPSEAEAIENVRMDYVQKLFRPENGLHPMKDVFSNLVFCCRIAKAVGQMQEYETRVNKLAGQRRKQKRENDDCPLDEIEIGRDRYASRFSFTRMFCWNSLRQSGYLAVVRDGKAARRAFIREIAALAHVGMDEAREMDRFYEFKTYEALGKMDEYNARRRAEWERAHPPPKSERPKTTFEFGTYPVSPELRRELDRYGMTAGFFTARSAASTNRLAYLLFTPKGKKLPSKVPLLAYLPGNGEIGEDVTRQFRQRALFKLVTSEDFQRKRPCYLLAVSPPDGTTAIFGRMPDGSPTDLQAAIGELIRGVARTRKSPQVDEARIYATGFSFGGVAVYGLAFAMPDLFAAAVPVSTTALDPGMVPDAPPSNYYHLYNEGDVRDLARERARLEAFGDRVRACGGDFRAGTFPKEGHNAWDAAWREEAVWDWLFSKRKGTAPAAGARKGAPVPRQTAATCTASRPGRDGKSGPERAADGLDGTAYVSDAPMGRGDWFQIAFAEPTSGRFTIKTGLADGRGRLTRGQVESSSDGRFWTKCARFQKDAGECAFEIRAHIRFLRILPEEAPPRPLIIREIRAE